MEKIKYKRGVIVEEDKTESEKIEIDASRMGNVRYEKGMFRCEGQNLDIATREGGNFNGKAIYLTDDFDWVLCKDDNAAICLVPLEKETK